jgi:hypothetical protein
MTGTTPQGPLNQLLQMTNGYISLAGAVRCSAQGTHSLTCSVLYAETLSQVHVRQSCQPVQFAAQSSCVTKVYSDHSAQRRCPRMITTTPNEGKKH